MPNNNKQKTPATAATPMFFFSFVCVSECGWKGGRNPCVCVFGDNLYYMSRANGKQQQQ